MKYKIPVSVLVLVHTADLQVLLLERADHPGFWQSVTGSQDAGETLLQTAQRELAEETGIVADAAALSDWQREVLDSTRDELIEAGCAVFPTVERAAWALGMIARSSS